MVILRSCHDVDCTVYTTWRMHSTLRSTRFTILKTVDPICGTRSTHLACDFDPLANLSTVGRTCLTRLRSLDHDACNSRQIHLPRVNSNVYLCLRIVRETGISHYSENSTLDELETFYSMIIKPDEIRSKISANETLRLVKRDIRNWSIDGNPNSRCSVE